MVRQIAARAKNSPGYDRAMADPLHQPRRWAVLAAYTAVVGLSQLLWLNFAPLITLVEKRYGVGELAASSLLLVFPLLYVVLSLPAGAMTDRRGYRFTVGAGAIVMAAFACVRIFDGSFAALFVGQLGIAVAQPFVVNGIGKLVADWFDTSQGVLATGLGTMGMFLGMAAGMAATPPLVDAVGLRGTMIVFAVVSIVVAAVFFAVVRENSPPTAEYQENSFKTLLNNKNLTLLFALAFLGLGVFNGLTTWLEQILAPHGMDSARAGLVGGALIVGGIVGAVAIPALSDVLGRRKPLLLGCAFGALLTLYPLCETNHYHMALALGALHGFAFMPAFALLLDMCAQLAGARAAGAATSLLMMAGNAGGVAVIVAMPLVSHGGNFHGAVLLMTALLATTALLGLIAPETAATPASRR
jgi:predicted MFS family arabinose efflux permease